MSRDWSGGIANREWRADRGKPRGDGMTPGQRRALYESVADRPFWCEVCNGHHPLREHRGCVG